MSLFRREPEPSAPSASEPRARPSGAPPSREKPVTRIAQGTQMVGRVSGTTELVIDGDLEGEIRLDGRLVVGEHGAVRGQISARSVQVAGKVTGNIHAHERVEVERTGNLEGDIAAPRVVIAEGAFFKGKVEMSDGSTRRGAEPARPAGRETPAAAPSPSAQPATHGRQGRDLFSGQPYGSDARLGKASDPNPPGEPGRGGE